VRRKGTMITEATVLLGGLLNHLASKKKLEVVCDGKAADRVVGVDVRKPNLILFTLQTEDGIQTAEMKTLAWMAGHESIRSFQAMIVGIPPVLDSLMGQLSGKELDKGYKIMNVEHALSGFGLTLLTPKGLRTMLLAYQGIQKKKVEPPPFIPPSLKPIVEAVAREKIIRRDIPQVPKDPPTPIPTEPLKKRKAQKKEKGS
jgi:hypothetical protein